MPRYLSLLCGLALAVFLVAAPWVYRNRQEARYRNFHVVKDGTLYRSGQMTLAGFQEVLTQYGIKTVITLRDTIGGPKRNVDEERFCQQRAVKFIRIPSRSWWASDGTVPAEEGVHCFRQIIAHPATHPVLIHCQAGMDRTGAFCAIFRMEFDGWSNAKAIAEMKALGYRNIDDEWDVLGYLEQYRPLRIQLVSSHP